MKPKILIQLDGDPQPSIFDAVVAVDSGVDHLFRHSNVVPEQVRDLVYGGLFTRGPEDLKNTALFIGGADVTTAERLYRAAIESFFGSFRLSILLDPNGANTTAAAAVLAAREGMGGQLSGVRAAVLGATGPVGQRVTRLLVREGAEVIVSSRKHERAEAVADAIQTVTRIRPTPASPHDFDSSVTSYSNVQVIIAAGSAGVTLLPHDLRSQLGSLQVAIDLNAVPPAGIEGVEVSDRDQDRDGLRTWGAIGVGGTKMEIHRAAVQALFESNEKTLDAEEVYAIGLNL